MNKSDKLNIVYEDKDLIVINKPAKLLTISTENEKERTLYHKIYMYLKKKNKNNKVFIVHRLDKETSGLIVFAKSEKAKRLLQKDWNKAIRNYVAVVFGKVEKDKDTLNLYLAETKTLMTYVSDKNDKYAEPSITNYEKVMGNNKYTMLDVNIKTGKKNQIRVSLSYIGNPIVGDKKYGPKTDPIRRMGLHANYLEFNHPITGERLKFDIDIPNSFIELCK